MYTISSIVHMMKNINLLIFCLVETRADVDRIDHFVLSLVENGARLLSWPRAITVELSHFGGSA